MNRQDFYYDQLVKQMDLDLLQDNAERGIGIGLKDTWGTGLTSIDIIAHEKGVPDMNVLVPAGSARVQESGTISTVGTLTNGSPIITDIPNTARLSKGDDISGSGVPGSTKILTVDGINQITMDKNSTADGSAVDLTITYIKYTRAVWITEQTIDCSQDWETNSTIPAAGKECYIACYVKQSRNLYDQRQDGHDPPNTIDYRQLEGAEFRVYKGADANPSNAVKVSSPGDEYELVFEVLFDENTTVINDAADKYNPGKDEIDYTDVIFVRSQELKDALGNFLALKDIAIGTIRTNPVSTIPNGWLECDGSAISQATYIDLYNILKDGGGSCIYGEGGGNFNLPDLRGEFVRGWDHGRGVDPDKATRTNRGDGQGGDFVGTKQPNATKLPVSGFTSDDPGDHSHTYNVAIYDNSIEGGSGFGTVGFGEGENTDNDGAHTHTITGGGDAESRSRNVNMIYIIKY